MVGLILTSRDVLHELVTPKFIVLWTFLASALYVHFRGRVRFKFTRQLTDHSTFMAPYNVLMYAFSAVPNQPYIPVASLPDLAVLRQNWQVIRDEALGLFDQGRIKA